MRKCVSPFVRAARRMAGGNNAYPEGVWERRVFEDHTWWKEYGIGFDARKVLPKKEYQAHLALIEGERKYRKAQQKREKQKAKRAGK